MIVNSLKMNPKRVDEFLCCVRGRKKIGSQFSDRINQILKEKIRKKKWKRILNVSWMAHLIIV